MAQLLLIARNYAECRGGNRGYFVGDCVHVKPDNWQPSPGEVPDNGFVTIELPGISVANAKERFEAQKISLLTVDPEYLGRRARGIDYPILNIPIHPALSKQPAILSRRSGRGISSHIESGTIVKLRAVIERSR